MLKFSPSILPVSGIRSVCVVSVEEMVLEQRTKEIKIPVHRKTIR